MMIFGMVKSLKADAMWFVVSLVFEGKIIKIVE